VHPTHRYLTARVRSFLALAHARLAQRANRRARSS
jgi:hypothetical protein